MVERQTFGAGSALPGLLEVVESEEIEMLFTLLGGLLVWFLLAFVSGCALGSFIRSGAECQVHQSEAKSVTPRRAA